MPPKRRVKVVGQPAPEKRKRKVLTPKEPKLKTPDEHIKYEEVYRHARAIQARLGEDFVRSLFGHTDYEK